MYGCRQRTLTPSEPRPCRMSVAELKAVLTTLRAASCACGQQQGGRGPVDVYAQGATTPISVYHPTNQPANCTKGSSAMRTGSEGIEGHSPFLTLAYYRALPPLRSPWLAYAVSLANTTLTFLHLMNFSDCLVLFQLLRALNLSSVDSTERGIARYRRCMRERVSEYGPKCDRDDGDNVAVAAMAYLHTTDRKFRRHPQRKQTSVFASIR
ncbi:hypothetical protein E2C01_027640 [Portunus trituberculatus]|uniref:Uncharacterized protein n=1 Tax=Portunus trituberculatus TaxID=210409 RepID=A0A5B7ELV0_PORTR|nr:hypothetical protein [Portunus trituberculatus]